MIQMSKVVVTFNVGLFFDPDGQAIHVFLLFASMICWNISSIGFWVGQDRYQKDIGGGSKKVPVAYSVAWLW